MEQIREEEEEIRLSKWNEISRNKKRGEWVEMLVAQKIVVLVFVFFVFTSGHINVCKHIYI